MAQCKFFNSVRSQVKNGGRTETRLADAARDRYRARHSTTEQAHGRRGEDLAHRFLRRQGLTIVARHFRQRSRRGELDIIAWVRQTLVFVEVKSRASAEFGSPGRAVGTDKEKDLRREIGRASCRGRG